MQALPSHFKPFRTGEFIDPTGWIKLNTNENPYGMSPDALEHLQSILRDSKSLFSRYPDPHAVQLRETIAFIYGVGRENVLVANGTSELIEWFARTFFSEDTPVGCVIPNYGFYESVASRRTLALKMIPLIPLHEWKSAEDCRQLPTEFSFNSEEIANLDFLCLSRPNVPTGLTISRDSLHEAARIVRRYLVVDEAYADFSGDSLLKEWKSFPKVVLFKTLSKSHALAGLRCAFVLAPVEVIAQMEKTQTPYNVNYLAQEAAKIALLDDEHLRKTTQKIIETRQHLEKFLEQLGWIFPRSIGNFVLFRPEKNGTFGEEVARELLDYLRSRKILLRQFKIEPYNSYLRASIGRPEENEILCRELKKWQEKN